MSIFSSKPTWIELNQSQFKKQCESLNTVKQLRRLTGDYCDGSVLAFWNKFGSSGKVMYMSDKKQNFWEGISDLFQHEINCVLSGHYYVGKLQVMARMGQFTSAHGTDVMTPAEYKANDADSNLDKATRWIISSSTSLVKSADDPNAPVNANKIKTALQTASAMDIRAEATLRYLHRELVNQATLRPTRGPAKEAPYPSTGGAGFLLKTTFDLAQGIGLPAPNDPRWFNLACYLFGAVVRSHGFTDGNGRVGRGAYAAAMLAGGLPFVALKPSAEKLIHGLDHVA
jgi:hypothetical protein